MRNAVNGLPSGFVTGGLRVTKQLVVATFVLTCSLTTQPG